MKIINDNKRLCLMGTVFEEGYSYAKISESDFVLLFKKPELLEKIDIIGPGVFRGYDLSNINFEKVFKNVQIIDKYAFLNCVLPQNITLPTKTRIIGTGAFCGAKNIKNLTITSGTKFIGNNAFMDTTIEKLTLEDDIAVIYDGAFEGCDNLKTIIADELPYVFKNTFNKNLLVNNGFVKENILEK